MSGPFLPAPEAPPPVWDHHITMQTDRRPRARLSSPLCASAVHWEPALLRRERPFVPSNRKSRFHHSSTFEATLFALLGPCLYTLFYQMGSGYVLRGTPIYGQLVISKSLMTSLVWVQGKEKEQEGGRGGEKGRGGRGCLASSVYLNCINNTCSLEQIK